MKRLFTLALTNLIMISAGWATTFQAVPMEKMIQPADAILLGDFLKSSTVVLEDGTVATEARFKIDKELGLDADEFGLSEIKVFYPGGKLKDREVLVEGAPSFVPGEKNVLMLSQAEDGRLWIQGLAMGTFKVVRLGQKTVLMNPVFPSDADLSRVEMSRFLRMVSALKNEPLREVYSDKYVRELQKDTQRTVSSEAGNSRSIASQSQSQENVPVPNVMNSFWLLLIFGFIGAFATWVQRKKSPR